MMLSVSMETATAAYKEYGVSLYSCTNSGRATGSAIATRKSYAFERQSEGPTRKQQRQPTVGLLKIIVVAFC